MNKTRAVDLLLDSGAFSAWYHGDSIDLKSYIAFIKDYSDIVENYVSLDTIPGSMGRMDRSQAEIEKSAAASYKNHHVMKDAGLSPIPVFHMGERFYWLDKMLAEGELYIGLSPYLRANTHDIVKWLDNCFTAITDSSGRPLLKTHGFGATGYQIITRYPWRSVDSTSWARGSGFGMIKVPQCGNNGVPNIMLPPRQVFVGDDGSGASSKFSFDRLPESQQRWVTDFVASLGLTITDLRNDPESRKAVNIGYFKLLERDGVARTFRYKRSSFGSTKPGRGACAAFEFKIVLAAIIAYHNQNSMMTRCGVSNRLLSYYELRKLPSDTLSRYVADGAIGADILNSRKKKQNWAVRAYRDFRSRALATRSESTDEQEAAT